MPTATKTRCEDAVVIRKSSDSQADAEQENNVRHLLKQRGVKVKEINWFHFTSARRKIMAGRDFEQVKRLIELGGLGNVYIESQDRLGGKDNKQLFSFLHLCKEHGTKVIDLTENRDITSDDFSDEIQVLLEGNKSQKEVRAIGRRSIRSRVHRFKEERCWVTGAAPFGYGKACFNAAGDKRWEWHPTESRTIGDLYRVTPTGKLSKAETGVKIPRKERSDKNFLVPNRTKQYVRSVQTVFEMFAKDGLSRREIAIRMNKAGRNFYSKPFTHSFIKQIIENPAYVGDTVFGKSQPGDFYSFSPDGTIINLEANGDDQAEQGAIVHADTHKGLISREVWELAQNRIEREQSGDGLSYAPRTADFWLKGILVCGHCGKKMFGRTDNGKPHYVCPTYSHRKVNGQEATCGFQTVSHALAEELITEKIKSIQIDLEDTKGGQRLEMLLEECQSKDDAALEANYRWHDEVEAAVESFADYLLENYDVYEDEYDDIIRAAHTIIEGFDLDDCEKSKLPKQFKNLRTIITKFEKKAIDTAKRKLKTVRTKHRKHTEAWVDASAMQREIIREKTTELEAEIEELEQKSLPVRQRISELYDKYFTLGEEMDELFEQWGSMAGQRRGEALRGILDAVVLTWDREWHAAETNPGRERKTDRKGRWRYTLRTKDIEFRLRSCETDVSL